MRYVINRKWAALCNQKPFILERPEHVQRAVMNMVYQMGVNGALGFRKMWDALQANDMAEAKAQALDSQWARNHAKRAARVVALMEGST